MCIRDRSIHVDVRIIATAGSELINRVNSGSFRMDLDVYKRQRWVYPGQRCTDC